MNNNNDYNFFCQNKACPAVGSSSYGAKPTLTIIVSILSNIILV